jgi:hypothetical protein
MKKVKREMSLVQRSLLRRTRNVVVDVCLLGAGGDKVLTARDVNCSARVWAKFKLQTASLAFGDLDMAQTTQAGQSLLERAGMLQEERYLHLLIALLHIPWRLLFTKEVENKRSIVSSFLPFTLDYYEAGVITSREQPAFDEIFAIMGKAERIRDDCRILMSGEEGPTQAG